MKPKPTRILNVEIPETEYWHIRKCATESRMSLKQFMAVFCKTARPVDQEFIHGTIVEAEADTCPVWPQCDNGQTASDDRVASCNAQPNIST